MPVAIGPEETDNPPILPGKKDSFGQSQGVVDDEAAKAENHATASKPHASDGAPEPSDSTPADMGLLQGDPNHQSVAKPPLGN